MVSVLQAAMLLHKQQHCVWLENGKKLITCKFIADKDSMLGPLFSLISTNDIGNVQID